MSDFVQEQTTKLNSTLSLIFQNENINASEVTVHSTPQQALEQDDITLFLTMASRDIDLSSQVPVDMELIKNYLVLYQASHAQNDLEWLFLAKCTVAVYGYMLRNILNSTLPLSEALQYWNSIYGSRRYEMYYALQTLPIRLGYLGIHSVQKMRTTQQKTSRELLSNMFPLHAKNWIKSSQQKTRQFFTMKRGSLFKELIHEEIRQKIHALNYFKTQQASRLGLLMKQTPFLSSHEEDVSNTVSLQANQFVTLMHRMMDPLMVDNFDLMKHEFSIKDIIETTKSVSPCQPSDIALGLIKTIDDWKKCESNIKVLKSFYGPPSFLTRYWIPGVLGYFVGNYAVKEITDKQDDIAEWLQELSVTAKDFMVNWIWEPLLHVWDTIRLKDERLSISGKEGLRSDVESLERMVMEFAQDHYQLPENQMNQVLKSVREGDMSLVLKAYEKEIKHPLKSVVQGDLIQTLLIQVQKTKVDVDLAMAALDKLLKSNELNFAFLAVAPSMLITWGSISWLSHVWQRRSGRNIGKIGLPIRQTMRRVERLLNAANGNSTSDSDQENLLNCEHQGILLCELHLLRSYAQRLPARNSVRDQFIEDVRDLENPSMNIAQKFKVIERMSRSWSFLHPSRS